jgi:hypothetical protein
VPVTARSGGGCQYPGGSYPNPWCQHMNNPPAMTVECLAEHVRLLDVATTDDHDELLLDLLEHAWPTRATQDS